MRRFPTDPLTPTFDDGTEFGDIASTTNSVTHTFTISNTGNASLTLSGSPQVQVSGADAQDFTVISQPESSVAAGATTTFQILFHPTAEGLRQATVTIDNNDAGSATSPSKSRVPARTQAPVH